MVEGVEGSGNTGIRGLSISQNMWGLCTDPAEIIELEMTLCRD